MKLSVTISILFFSIICNAQIMVLGVKVPEPAAPSGTQRILIDFGGDGVADDLDGAGGAGSVADNGSKTPNNSAGATGQDANGRWWNNIVDVHAAGTIISNPVDTANNVVTGFSISVDKKPGGTFNVNDLSINTAGTNSAVGDYPATAVQDNLYFYPGAGVVSFTFIIPSGKTASIKFWGNRAATGPRILQLKKSTDASYTLEYESANNTNYNTAVTFTGLTGTVVINCQVKSGSTFGHLSVLDITIN